jgi:hypothetical protein
MRIPADNIVIINLLIVVVLFSFFCCAAAARRTWSPLGSHFMASQRKRETAAFHPRLLKGWPDFLFGEQIVGKNTYKRQSDISNYTYRCEDHDFLRIFCGNERDPWVMSMPHPLRVF